MLQKMEHDRVSLFGIEIDALDMQQSVAELIRWIDEPATEFRYVVTPNVDHIVMLQKHLAFQQAYADASLVVADGWPVVTASRWLKRALPERVPGSDLVPNLFEVADEGRPLTTFLLGAADGVGEIAAANIERRWPHVNVVGTYSPPMGFEKSADETKEILKRIADVRPQILVVGLGAPKQELWVHRHQQEIQADVGLCVGATIDFLAGQKKRAPVWIQKIRMEWLHRMLSEPKRLVKRYARDAWIFPRLVLKEFKRKKVESRE